MLIKMMMGLQAKTFNDGSHDFLFIESYMSAFVQLGIHCGTKYGLDGQKKIQSDTLSLYH